VNKFTNVYEEICSFQAIFIGRIIASLALDPNYLGCFPLIGRMAKHNILPPWSRKANNWVLI